MSALERVALGLVQRLAGAGPAGFVGVNAVFLAWVMLTLPTTPLELGLAFVYGLPTGLAVSVFGKTAGSALAFLCCRTVGKSAGWRVPARLTDQMSKMDQHAHPLMSLVMIRMAPIPLGLKNYGLALIPSTDFGLFTLASLIVNVPFSIMWCLLGSQAKNLPEALAAAKRIGGKASAAIIGAGAGACLLVWLANRAMKQRRLKKQ